MKKNKLFYVEMKNASGEYEPLGVMTMEDAFAWSWEHGHAALQFTTVRELHKAETR